METVSGVGDGDYLDAAEAAAADLRITQMDAAIQAQKDAAPKAKTGFFLRSLSALKGAGTAIVLFAIRANYEMELAASAIKTGATKVGERFVAASSNGLKAVGAFLLEVAEAAGKGLQLLLGGIFFAVGSALKGGYTAGKDFKLEEKRQGPATFKSKMKDVGDRLSAAFNGFKEEGGKGLTAGGKWMQTVCRMAKEAIQARRDAAADAAE